MASSVLRRFLASLAVAVFLIPWVTTPTVVHAEAAARDGLAVSSVTTYTVDPSRGVVHVLAEMTFTNTLPDQREGVYIRRRYFTGFSIAVPVGANDPMATTSRGTPVNVTPRLVSGVDTFYVLDVDFASNLFYQQTARINVSYDITGLDPRDHRPSRVNLAYAAFEAFGIGDAGKVTVKVVVPQGFDVETFGTGFVTTVEGGNKVYTATDIEQPDEFSFFVSARNDGALDYESVLLGDATFAIRAWPDDPAWAEFVHTQVEDGVPLLETLLGQDWPITDEVEIREAYTPYLYGYAGWFETDVNEIEIDEELDQHVVLHELSHAWFNGDLFDDRWMSEGYAQVYANAAAVALGGEDEEPDQPRAGAAGHVQLSSWRSGLSDSGTDDEEAYGYNASYWVVQQLFDEIGEDGMRQVLAAVADGTTPYIGETGEAEVTSPGAADWKRLLDLFEEIGGSDDVEALFEKWVLTSSQAALLDDRATARDAYHGLADDGGEWAVPDGLRDEMEGWQFDDAQALVTTAQEVLAARDDLNAIAADMGQPYPDGFETEYQAATSGDDLDAVTADIADQIDAAEEVLAATELEGQDDGFFGGIGLIGTNLPTLLDQARVAWSNGDLDTARELADEVTRTVDTAPDVGRTRALTVAGIVVGVLVLITGLIWFLRRRGRRKRDRAAAAAVAADGAAGPGETEAAATEAAHTEPGEPDQPEPEADQPAPDVPDQPAPDQPEPDQPEPDEPAPA